MMPPPIVAVVVSDALQIELDLFRSSTKALAAKLFTEKSMLPKSPSKKYP